MSTDRGDVPPERSPVPAALRVSAAVSWRFLLVVAALYVIGVIFSRLAALAVPLAIALLLAALLTPAVGFLMAHRVPRGLATALVLVGGLLALGGMLAFVVVTFVNGLPDLAAQLARSIDAISGWLVNGPPQLSETQLRDFAGRIAKTAQDNQYGITTGAITTAATVGGVLGEMLLVLFTLAFLLYDGPRIWRFLLRVVPDGPRRRVDVAGRRSLAALVSYVRATGAVAVVDAIGIGIGLAVLRVPLAVPLAALVFICAFVPIFGAVVAGAVAVLIALVANGPLTAVIVLIIVIAVNQLESHVLQPFLLGRAVKLHPLAVVLAIAAGLLVAGIAGALLAVPLLAVLNSAIRSLRSEADEHVSPADVHTSQPEESGPDEPGLDTEAEK
ncbi:AI-2E family transporter [Lentzea albida]|uniref:Predicted PurR-regulated permease PerM n=1 Tax=Lentzea albida TaxID=65499 RepID=A0A1H9X5Y3_9PSEU|nr:AI-2E family transporter [Lentzea albida]SES41277.1 Predicted PurR-regulated permease PerM [Lentzea albida]